MFCKVAALAGSSSTAQCSAFACSLYLENVGHVSYCGVEIVSAGWTQSGQVRVAVCILHAWL